MGDENNASRGGRNQPSLMPALSLFLRVWHERSDEQTPHLRGTIRNMAGAELGAFDGADGLGQLLAKLLSDEKDRRF